VLQSDDAISDLFAYALATVDFVVQLNRPHQQNIGVAFGSWHQISNIVVASLKRIGSNRIDMVAECRWGLDFISFRHVNPYIVGRLTK
jgi:hypothetical protein